MSSLKDLIDYIIARFDMHREQAKEFINNWWHEITTSNTESIMNNTSNFEIFTDFVKLKANTIKLKVQDLTSDVKVSIQNYIEMIEWAWRDVTIEWQEFKITLNNGMNLRKL